MLPWLIVQVSYICLSCLGIGVVCWLLLRPIQRALTVILSEQAATQANLLDRLRDLRVALADLEARLQEAAAVPAEHPLTGLTFMPTEASAAEIERDLRRAEDHAISSVDPIRYSSRPSRGLPGKSSREPSTQRQRRSG